VKIMLSLNGVDRPCARASDGDRCRESLRVSWREAVQRSFREEESSNEGSAGRTLSTGVDRLVDDANA